MKAAIMYQNRALPAYAEVPDPITTEDDELLVTVKAVAIKHYDKGRASGKHYSADAPGENGRIVGGDGVCLLPDGTRVYGMGNGMMAEKAVINKHRMVPIPAGLDDATAAALPNAVIGSAMGLKYKAAIQPGDVVLVNGATGFTGSIAVQLAKYYGAGKVIVTGRNKQSLDALSTLGADIAISLLQDEQEIKTQLKTIHTATPVDIVIDYLWGRSAEIILDSIRGDGAFTNRIRYVSVGSMAGDLIQLSSAILRSVNIQLTGSGLGSWPVEQVALLFSEILPETFQLAADGKLVTNTAAIPLQDISSIWDSTAPDGGRFVVII